MRFVVLSVTRDDYVVVHLAVFAIIVMTVFNRFVIAIVVGLFLQHVLSVEVTLHA